MNAELPKGWKSVRLGDYLNFLTSGSRGWAKYYDDNGGDIFIRIGNVGKNALLLDRDVQYVRAPSDAEARRTKVMPGDVLLSITADLGRTAVIPDSLGNAYINQHLAILRPKGIFPAYLSQFLSSPGGQRQVKRLDRGGVKSGLNFDDIQSLEIPLPPLDEQRRIAAILDKADAIRRKRQQALALAGDFLRSAFLEMFGDLSKNDRVWPLETLGNHIIHANNGLSRRRKFPENVGQIVLRIQDIKANSIDFSQPNRIALDENEIRRFKLQGGDLLFVRVNGNPDYVGRCTVFHEYPEPVFHNDHLIRLRFGQRFNQEFVSFLFNTAAGRKLLSGAIKTSAGQYTISQDGINELKLPSPPLMLQEEFGGLVVTMGRNCERLSAARRESDFLFASLSQRAFRGAL